MLFSQDFNIWDILRLWDLIFSVENVYYYTYYINRLMVDDKEVEATQYSGIVYGKSSYISSIEIEKSFLSQNKKIRISFLVQTDDKSVYKSNEKEFDL